MIVILSSASNILEREQEIGMENMNKRVLTGKLWFIDVIDILAPFKYSPVVEAYDIPQSTTDYIYQNGLPTLTEFTICLWITGTDTDGDDHAYESVMSISTGELLLLLLLCILIIIIICYNYLLSSSVLGRYYKYQKYRDTQQALTDKL